MNAILELDKKLTEDGIPHELIHLFDGYGICYPSQKDWQGDVVCHMGSYGGKQGLMEAMGFDITPEKDGDSVVGYLTLDNAYSYFARQWEKDNHGQKA